jgi:hypothetical protein
MITNNYNSLNYLENTFEQIKAWRNEYEYTYLKLGKTFIASCINLTIASIVVPALLVYEISLCVFKCIKYIYSQNSFLKTHAFEHLITALEIPPKFCKFLFAALLPCLFYEDFEDDFLYTPRIAPSVKPIEIKTDVLDKIITFLDDTKKQTHYSKKSLTELALSQLL